MPGGGGVGAGRRSLREHLREAEREYVQQLDASGLSVNECCRIAGVSRCHWHRLRVRYGVPRRGGLGMWATFGL